MKIDQYVYPLAAEKVCDLVEAGILSRKEVIRNARLLRRARTAFSAH